MGLDPQFEVGRLGGVVVGQAADRGRGAGPELVDLHLAAALRGARRRAGFIAAITWSRLASSAARTSSAGADSARTARLNLLMTSRSTRRTSPMTHCYRRSRRCGKSPTPSGRVGAAM